MTNGDKFKQARVEGVETEATDVVEQLTETAILARSSSLKSRFKQVIARLTKLPKPIVAEEVLSSRHLDNTPSLIDRVASSWGESSWLFKGLAYSTVAIGTISVGILFNMMAWAIIITGVFVGATVILNKHHRVTNLRFARFEEAFHQNQQAVELSLDQINMASNELENVITDSKITNDQIQKHNTLLQCQTNTMQADVTVLHTVVDAMQVTAEVIEREQELLSQQTEKLIDDFDKLDKTTIIQTEQIVEVTQGLASSSIRLETAVDGLEQIVLKLETCAVTRVALVDEMNVSVLSTVESEIDDTPLQLHHDIQSQAQWVEESEHQHASQLQRSRLIRERFLAISLAREEQLGRRMN